MLAPHLIFSHLLADYVLQTNWVAAGKAKFEWRHPATWDGLLLHGFIVWLISLAVLLNQIAHLWPYITLIAIVHVLQDALKVSISRHLHIHSVIPYLLDQFGHLLAILLLQSYLLNENLLNPPPGSTEVQLMILGASIVALTRPYEVSWWANWLDMIPYMRRWQWWGYAERSVMFALAAFGLWWLTPLIILPRLYVAWREGNPIGQQKYGLAEMLLGIAFSVILGQGLQVV